MDLKYRLDQVRDVQKKLVQNGMFWPIANSVVNLPTLQLFKSKDYILSLEEAECVITHLEYIFKFLNESYKKLESQQSSHASYNDVITATIMTFEDIDLERYKEFLGAITSLVWKAIYDDIQQIRSQIVNLVYYKNQILSKLETCDQFQKSSAFTLPAHEKTQDRNLHDDLDIWMNSKESNFCFLSPNDMIWRRAMHAYEVMLEGFILHFTMYRNRIRQYKLLGNDLSVSDAIRAFSESKLIADSIFNQMMADKICRENFNLDFTYLNLMYNLINQKINNIV